MAVNPIPDGFHTVTPYIVVSSAAGLIDWLQRAFDAREVHRSENPGGGIMHAQVQVGDSVLMMADAQGPWSPMPSCFYLYVPDTDAVYKRALQAGATSVMEPADQFYGDRNAGVKDPFGNLWWIGTHIEDLSDDELKKRIAEYKKQ